MFRNNPLFFLLCLALIPAYGAGLALLLIWWLRSISDHIQIAGGKVVYTRGLLSKDLTELNTATIRSVRVRQSFFQRIFSTGDLLIFTAGDKPEITISGIPHPHDAKKLLEKPQDQGAV
jgi:uncharacterized membrane protein YdbT with pleckstrin-like domain